MTTVAQFSIEFFQFLDRDGKVLQPLPAFAKNTEELLKMYRMMNLTRVMDAKAVNLQRMGKMGTYPSSLGQEGFSIGMGTAMHKDDVFVPYYRDQGAMLCRGVKISEILAYWGGDERANNYAAPQAGEDFPISVPVGSQNLHAAGIAYAIKFHQQKRAAVCGCGEGGTSKGDFYEAMNFAGVYQLPVVFVVNNNQWAISVSRKIQTAAQTIAQKAIAAGIPGVQADGNDVIAVRYAIGEAIKRARENGGPTLVETVTYRLCDHTTADDAKRYSEEKDIKAAWELEPILRLRKYLYAQKIWTEQQEQQMLTECNAEVDRAIQEYFKITPAAKTDIFDYLYAQLPEELIEQREILLQNSEQAHHG